MLRLLLASLPLFMPLGHTGENKQPTTSGCNGDNSGRGQPFCSHFTPPHPKGGLL